MDADERSVVLRLRDYQTLTDGTVILPTGNDPAVEKVSGWSRYWLAPTSAGLDVQAFNQ